MGHPSTRVEARPVPGTADFQQRVYGGRPRPVPPPTRVGVPDDRKMRQTKPISYDEPDTTDFDERAALESYHSNMEELKSYQELNASSPEALKAIEELNQPRPEAFAVESP